MIHGVLTNNKHIQLQFQFFKVNLTKKFYLLIHLFTKIIHKKLDRITSTLSIENEKMKYG